MRKRRAIIYDDEAVILLVLRRFFEARGYEVLAFPEPVVCPIYHSGGSCANRAACGDVILSDFKMPRMNGVDLFRSQALQGCKLTIRNKALVSGFLDEGSHREVCEMGAAFFNKPLLFDELNRWVNECEGRMDLSLPLGIPGNEDRHDDDCGISDDVSAADGPI